MALGGAVSLRPGAHRDIDDASQLFVGPFTRRAAEGLHGQSVYTYRARSLGLAGAGDLPLAALGSGLLRDGARRDLAPLRARSVWARCSYRLQARPGFGGTRRGSLEQPLLSPIQSLVGW